MRHRADGLARVIACAWGVQGGACGLAVLPFPGGPSLAFVLACARGVRGCGVAGRVQVFVVGGGRKWEGRAWGPNGVTGAVATPSSASCLQNRPPSALPVFQERQPSADIGAVLWKFVAERAGG